MDIGTSKAAELLGVTQKTVQEWCRAGEIQNGHAGREGKAVAYFRAGSQST